MKRLCAAILMALCAASPVQATVIFSETFEGESVGAYACDTAPDRTAWVAAHPGYTSCREAGSPVGQLSIVSSVTGSSGTLPSGTKVLKSYVNGQTQQGEAELRVHDPDSSASDNWWPADAWFQVAYYVNYSGSESSITSTDRVQKFIYACAGSFPCSNNYWLLELGTQAYLPNWGTPSGQPSSGNLYLILGVSKTTGTPCWAGWSTIGGLSAADCHKIGQTSLAEWIKPNRWNIVRCHFNFSNTAAGAVDCWIGEKGSALTQVIGWHGGDTVAGYSFTWTVPTATGNRAFDYGLVTVPSNNITGNEVWSYTDDVYLATSSADLPTYTTGNSDTITPPRTGVNANIRAEVIDSDHAEVTGLQCVSLRTTGRGMSRRVTCVH